MQVSDVMQYLKVGRSKTVVVFCELCQECLGYVKTITILKETLVRVDFDVYGYNEGGVTYFIAYDNFCHAHQKFRGVYG